ncbi:MAG: cation:proton antiporter [Candidatus Babeliales bacterium]
MTIKGIAVYMSLFFISTISAVNEEIAIPPQLLMRSGFNPVFVAKFALFIALLLAWTIFWGKILNKLIRLPSIAGQIIGGILLGPSVLNIADVNFFSDPLALIEYTTGKAYIVFSSDLFIFFILLLSSALTISYLLWIAGHETDIHDILSIGLTAVSAGVFGVFFPIVMTAGVLYYGLGAESWSNVQAISLGIVFAATSVSIPIAMLFSYNKMQLKSSKVTLGAAVIDDIVAVVVLSLFFLSLQAGVFGDMKDFTLHSHGYSMHYVILAMILTFIGLAAIGYFVVTPFIRWLKNNHLSHFLAPVATIIMLLFFGIAELAGGLAGITGAYFAGFFYRMGDTACKAEKVIAPFVDTILLPLFLGSIGLQIDISMLGRYEWGVVILLLIVAIASKLIGCWLATALSNVSRGKGSHRWSGLETFLFGSAMVTRGEVGLVIATILYGSHLLLPQQYIIAVVVIVLSTIAAPIMLAVGFAQLDITTIRGDELFALNIGMFPIIGTTQMFNIILGRLEKSGMFNTSIQFSNGRKIVNLEGQNVEIILCPDEGILFKGNINKINEILAMVKGAVIIDVERLSTS